ncbi:MAG: glutamate--tRNA ligase [Candidatus Goldiibacteriota bacterium HGW-Goldbacteria-1]|jgi:glutamyl-tRNA synthetase|nr:MAG: glutamate--tRNA ligase [Candidatus Goldiibacteriota bacterium HGW-Goldbacteria-1]
MIKVRFAPSPTGYLHIGGARTALFNYLFAKRQGGVFVLRIEDTDKERSTKESEQEILDSLKWLGLDWDEGPGKSADDSMYYQTKRLDVYHKHAEKLIADGKAYKCFCTKEELDAERKKAEAEKRAFKYDSRCALLTPEQVKANEAAGKTYTVRLKVPKDGEVIVEDMIRGDVRTANSVLDDMIILRADGMPIYNFVVVVDDADMGITHVIRGEDHLSNTPKQIHMYKALGYQVPKFAHIPLILGRDKSKLSKRHGETAVLNYRKMGYLKEAMVNYLAFLGWSPESGKDIMTMEELISEFDLTRVHKAGAMFDDQKLQWINGMYIRKKSIDELTDLCIPQLINDGYITEAEAVSKRDYLKKVVVVQQEKLKLINEIGALSSYFFKDDVEMQPEAQKVWEKNAEERVKVLEVLLKIVEEEGTEDKPKVEERVRVDMEAAGIKSKVYMHVIRVALSGATQGPGLFDLIEIVGKDRCIKRIKKLMV